MNRILYYRCMRMTSFIALGAFFFLLCFPLAACKGQHKGGSGPAFTKRSHLAGSWYPSSKSELSGLIDSYFKNVKDADIKGARIEALIVPHAGYVYSGQVAAHAYKILQGLSFQRVVLLSPSHYAGNRGFSTAPFSRYETPLGTVEVDIDAVKTLESDKLHFTDLRAHEAEHALEIHLPFLQKTLGSFKLVGILIGELTESDFDTLSGLFSKLRDEKTLFVVSSDFTHYGSRFGYTPFKFKKKPSGKEVKEALKKLDYGAVDFIENLDFAGFRKYCAETGITVCGRNAIALVLKMFGKDKNTSVKTLNYATSIDITGDYSSSVSYASLVILKDGGAKGRDGKIEKKEMTGVKKVMNGEYDLSQKERGTLLKIARDTLALYLSKKKYPKKDDYEITQALEAQRGVFVTLHKQGALRGCIGYIEGIKPVYRAVMENAVNAALEDPRFRSVDAKELKDIDIEISVMTPLTPVSEVEEIEVGRHGLVISRGPYRGLLLPQVATEWKWDRNQFLEGVSAKAGLPKDAWKDKGTELLKFAAIVFGEKDKK